MKLAEIIVDNERKKQAEKNKQLIRQRLKDLVYAYPKEVLQVLHRTGVAVSSLLPPSVLLAVVIKHVQRNTELRDAIAKMLIEMDGYSSADGTVLSLVASSLTAVGSVLAGIGRSQSDQLSEEQKIQQNNSQQELEKTKARAKRDLWITIGVRAVAIVAVIIAFSYKPKPKAQFQVQ